MLINIDDSTEMMQVADAIGRANHVIDILPESQTKDIQVAVAIVNCYRNEAKKATGVLERFEAVARAHAAAGILNVMLPR